MGHLNCQNTFNGDRLQQVKDLQVELGQETPKGLHRHSKLIYNIFIYLLVILTLYILKFSNLDPLEINVINNLINKIK